MENFLKEAALAHAKKMHPNPAMATFREYSADDFEAGAKWEASRHNSKAENLWQSLNAFKIAVIKNMEGAIPDSKLIEMLALVDQCLLENKPETLVP